MQLASSNSFIDLLQAFQQQTQELVALETIVLQTLGKCHDGLFCLSCAGASG